MRPILSFTWSWAFTLFGICSLLVLWATSHGLAPAQGLWRLLMVPAYASAIVMTILVLGPIQWALGLVGLGEPPPGWFQSLTLPLALLPFLLVDLHRHGWRGRAGRGR